MKKPTERQIFILRFAEKNLIRITDVSCSIVRGYSYARHGSERGPSMREIGALVDAGLITLEIDPNHWTENTQTGVKRQHHRARITATGKSALENHQ